MTLTDYIIEDKADEHTRHVVKGRRRRHAARAGKDDREVDVLEEIDLELPVQNPLE